MKRIDFLATDGVILNGLLYESNNKTKNKEIVIAIHGMSSNCFKKRDEIIAKNLNEEGIDYFCFNNRGSDLVRYLRKDIDGKKEKILQNYKNQNHIKEMQLDATGNESPLIHEVLANSLRNGHYHWGKFCTALYVELDSLSSETSIFH